MKPRATPLFWTLAEVCFTLGLRNERLAPELGRPDMFNEACRAATNANRAGLAAILDAIGRVHRASGENRIHALVDLAQILPARKADIEPWLLVELGSRPNAWIQELEAAVFNSDNAAILIKLLPPFYALRGTRLRASAGTQEVLAKEGEQTQISCP
jgi:hypothetical protein